MRKRYCCLLPLFAIALLGQEAPGTGVRLIFGLGDTDASTWNGSVTAQGAQVTAIDPWRFEGADAAAGSRWQVQLHHIRLFGNAANLQNAPFVANGVIVRLSNANPDVALHVETQQGNFDLRLADIPYGKAQYQVNGRVMVDRIPPVTQITATPDEQDCPAAATDKNGNIWLAFTIFRHNANHNKLRANLRTALEDFSSMTAPTGGDQVLVRKFDGNAWGAPIAITAPGGDLYRPAIAIDGTGRPWVFWSQNDGGNFDVYARAIENGQPGRTVRLSTEAGSDVDAVAATDSKGRVWLAWQGWRNGKAQIFCATQNGNAFTPAAAITTSTGNEWNPAIAADANGHVTVAWDSYRNGNYDIFMRTATNANAWGKEMPVAASARYEAYPSIAYDAQGRLWVAYEEGAEAWGKNFGAYETSGVALYQGRAVRIRGFELDGRAVELTADPGALMPGVMSQRVDTPTHQNDSNAWLTPDPTNAQNRRANASATNMAAPRNTLPRLSIDSSGRMWLAFRSANPVWWNPIGTVWTEFAMSYDGSSWTAPVYLAQSDNLLDNRPALASRRAGELTIVGSSDGRRQFHRIQNNIIPNGMDPDVAADPYDNDLYANVIALAPGHGAPSVKQGGAISVSGAVASDKAENDAIARMRGYRVQAGGSNLRIVRGEFHRHSEISMDGGSDGTLVDQWRYIIDAGGLDWVGCCDHDNGGGREYTWWIEQKLTDIYHAPGKFAPLFSYERSVVFPEGHRNVLFVQRGVRTLPRLMPRMQPGSTGSSPDTQMLYRYLKKFNGVTASHTSGTNMGTDWRDNDGAVETSVEIYQGDRQNYEKPGAPRSNSATDSIGGWRPKGFVDLALEMGYKLSFEASSDHVSTHMSYGNVITTDVTREAVLDGLKKRHVYAATDNILADVRSGDHLIGDAFSTADKPELKVKLVGTAPFSKVWIVKDNQYVYSTDPGTENVSFTWRDAAATPGKTSYYYVRGEQKNGEIVWVSPMWITYTGK
jgi:hypothetical protein